MKIAISQPTYLPWLGYFDLIDQVDTFVFLDSVQFEKQSWQHRNRIKTPVGLQWLTVPVAFRGRFGQLIHEVAIRDGEFSRKHLRAIELNYRRAPFFTNYFCQISQILQKYSSGASLAALNIELIRWGCGILGIQTRLVRSSELNEPGRRSERLVNLCRRLNAHTYISPPGSAVYLLDDLGLFADAHIEVAFHHYQHPEYKHLFPPFTPYASMIDLMFNEGPRAGEILRSGRREADSPEMLNSAVAGATA